MRFLLILLTIYLVSRIFFRYIFPIILRNFVNRAAQGMEGQFRQQHYQQFNSGQQPGRPEGEVIIEKPANKNPDNRRASDEEFADYTEIK